MRFLDEGSRTVGDAAETRLERQKTLKTSIGCVGIGLHSGIKVSMMLRPAPIDAGIFFHRTDISGRGAVIPARWNRVTETRLCTTVGNDDGVSVATVEHLMAALAGCGIDNVEIEINGPEVPAMDGSSEPFVFLIECAGIQEQDAPRRAVKVLKPIMIEGEGCSASLVPDDVFSVAFEIDFETAAISRQTLAMNLGNGTFKRELARARTFGLLQDVERLWAAGLARGGSMDNAVVVSNEGVLNKEGLRFEDEFVRHKVLDAVGDLYLAGAPLVGRFTGVCSGHALNNRLLRAMFADPEAWCFDRVRFNQTPGSPLSPWPEEARPRELAAASA